MSLLLCMKKDTPKDAIKHILYANFTVILSAAVTGVLFVITVPALLTHLVEFVTLILIVPLGLLSDTVGLYWVISNPLYVPPEACALLKAYPAIVLTVIVPVVIVADEAVINFPRGTTRYISAEFEVNAPYPHTIPPVWTVSPAL